VASDGEEHVVITRSKERRPRLVFILAGVFSVLAIAVMLHHTSRRFKCFWQLTGLDDIINSPDLVEMAKSDEKVGEDGRWDEDYVTSLFLSDELRCPVTGEQYTAEYVVGNHPICPHHGDLVAWYGRVGFHGPSGGGFGTVLWSLGSLLVFPCAAFLAIWAVLPLLVDYFIRKALAGGMQGKHHNHTIEKAPK